MKTAILLVLCLVAVSSGLKIFDQNSAISLACCGQSSFDTTTQFCCINSVFSTSNNNNGQCCGNNVLRDNQQCCLANSDGVVSLNDRAIDAGLTCCGTNGFDSSKQICCGDHVFSNTNNNLECCGNTKTFDSSKDLCCATASAKVDCSGTTITTNYNVISNGLTQSKQCCGNSAFDSTQLCCGSTDNPRVVSSNNNVLQCCGDSTYDPTKQTCCSTTDTVTFTDKFGNDITVTVNNGQVSSGASLTCCDGSLKAFDSSRQICCGGNVITQNNANTLSCCGPKSYDTNSQTCCSKEVSSLKKVSSCCGGCDTFVVETSVEFNVGSPANGDCCDLTPFDNSQKICCNGNLFSQNSNSALQCCGDQSFDTNQDICCTDTNQVVGQVFKGKLNNNNNNIDFQCCLNVQTSSCSTKFNFALYDTSKQSCPCGVVIDITKDISVNNNNPNVQAGCCGTTQVDVNHKTCCPGAIYDIDPAIGLTCCQDDGKTLYNPGYQVCCGKPAPCPTPCNVHSKIVRDVEEAEEVEEVEANKSKKGNSNKNKKNKNKGKVQCGDSCCNGNGYFNLYQKCCQGNILDFNGVADNTSPMACCGGVLYNANFDKCCVETNIKSVDACGIKADVQYGVFDDVSQICCGNGVITF